MLASDLYVTVSTDDEHAGMRQLLRQEFQEEERGFVGTMQVVEDEDERLVFRLFLEECSDSAEETKTCLLGLYDTIETAFTR